MYLGLSNYPYIELRAAENACERAATGAFCKLTVAYLQQSALDNKVNKLSERPRHGSRVLVLFCSFDFKLSEFIMYNKLNSISSSDEC